MATLNKELDPRFAKAFGAFAGVIGFVTVYMLYASLGKLTPLLLDNSYLILYADAILEGNVFLNGWELTTVGFYTELPFYVVAVAISGVKPDLMRTVPAFIYTVNLSLIGVIIWRYRTSTSPWVLVPFVAYLVLPANGMWKLGIHGAMHHVTTMAVLITCFVIGSDLLGTGRRTSVIVFIIAVVAAWADMAFAFFLTIPILVTILYHYQKEPESRAKSMGIVGYPIMVGTLVGVVLSRLMRPLGVGAPPGVGGYVFDSMERFEAKVSNSIFDFMSFFGADFWGKGVNYYSIALVFMLAGLIMWLFVSREAILRRNEPIDSLSAAMLTVIILTTSVSYRGPEIYEARFLVPAYFVGVLCISRQLGRFQLSRIVKIACSVVLLSAAISAGYFINSNRILLSGTQFGARLRGPVDFLRQRGLSDGFADVWASHLLRVQSGNSLNLVTISGDTQRVRPRHWASDARWLKRNKGNFVVLSGEVFGDPASGGVHSRDAVEAVVNSYWGSPTERHEIDGLVILLYDHEMAIQKQDFPDHLR